MVKHLVLVIAMTMTQQSIRWTLTVMACRLVLVIVVMILMVPFIPVLLIPQGMVSIRAVMVSDSKFHNDGDGYDSGIDYSNDASLNFEVISMAMDKRLIAGDWVMGQPSPLWTWTAMVSHHVRWLATIPILPLSRCRWRTGWH